MPEAPDANERTRAVVAEVAATAYGRLVAYLAASTRDIAAAEDAVADALEAALRTWPRTGVPASPEAWLLQVARRSTIGAARRRAVADRARPSLALLADARATPAPVPRSPVPDKRLELMFACAHPALDRGAHAPLMLQTVLGLDAARIASAFLVAPAAMAQRLVRAKTKIRAAGVPFEIPSADALGERLPAVLDAIYASFGSGWDDPTGTDGRRAGLAAESLRLVRIVTATCPDEPEAHGLHALIAHSHARAAARRDAAGRFVPLAEQEPAAWDHALADEGDRHLDEAVRLGGRGPFQIHAVIQASHNRRRTGAPTDWTWIANLYRALVTISPSVGAQVAWAAATCEAGDAAGARRLLDELDAATVGQYQPYWATRAHVAARLGDDADRVRSARLAVGLADDPAVREHLLATHGPLG